MSEIEVKGENKSKNMTEEKKIFFSFNLKVIKTNSYRQKSLIRLSYMS